MMLDTPPRLLVEADTAFEASFDKSPFLFRHNLHKEAVFALETISTVAVRLAGRPSPRGYFLRTSKPSVGDWGSDTFRQAVADGLADVRASGARLKLSSIHLEPEFRDAVGLCVAELDALTGGELLRLYPGPIATLFVSAPNEITPYHVDSEVNFLLQISGRKTVYLYDRADRALIGTRDFERYWALGKIDKPERSDGTPYELMPGLGVHHPAHAPHWVRNGEQPSISLSLGFSSPHDLSDVYRLNYHLRRLGIPPGIPGTNLPLDSAKRAAVRTARTLKYALKGKRAPGIKLR